MDWIIVAAVIVVVIILLIIYRQRQWNMKYASSRFGYFINQTHLGAIFPQTGELLIVSQISGNNVIAMISPTNELVAKPYAEFGGRFIVIPDLNKVSATAVDPGLILYLCSTVGETIDAEKTPCIYAMLDGETKMPVIKADGNAKVDGAIWKFHPVALGPMERLRRLIGSSGMGIGGARRSIFSEIPSKLPAWVAKNPEFANALKSGTFKGSLKNVKFAGMTYPMQGVVQMKTWGPVGIMMIPNTSSTDSDPQVLLVPTGTNMVFRAFSLQTATPNKETGKLEGYRQLVALTGAGFEFSKKIIDTDAARWTLVLAS